MYPSDWRSIQCSWCRKRGGGSATQWICPWGRLAHAGPLWRRWVPTCPGANGPPTPTAVPAYPGWPGVYGGAPRCGPRGAEEGTAMLLIPSVHNTTPVMIIITSMHILTDLRDLYSNRNTWCAEIFNNVYMKELKMTSVWKHIDTSTFIVQCVSYCQTY